MKILFLNPHRSDFVYDSPLYSIIGRKSLKKYGYLSHFFECNSVEFRFLTSSFYARLNNMGLPSLDRLFLKIEKYLFHKKNQDLNINFSLPSSENYDLIIGFGFAIRDIQFVELEKISQRTNFFLIHLSHYHLYANLLNRWSGLANVIFCADSDIRNNFIFKYYVDNCPKFEVLSFIPNFNRFKVLNPGNVRIQKVISTGTFHKFECSERNDRLKNNLLVKPFGLLSLHPERRIIFSLSEKLELLNSYISELEPSNFFTFFLGRSKMSQKNYFKLDIVQLYNEHQFAFIGEEITGLPGIGIVEAALSGCIPIIKRSCYLGTPFENSAGVIYYDSLEDLIFILNDGKLIDQYVNTTLSNELLNRVLKFYTAEFQISTILNLVSKNE